MFLQGYVSFVLMKRTYWSSSKKTGSTSLLTNRGCDLSWSEPNNVLNCVCQRECGVIQCTRCNHLFNGRISTVCPIHSSVTYLMDVRSCFYCLAPYEFLKYANTEMQQVKKYEDYKIPDETNCDL